MDKKITNEILEIILFVNRLLLWYMAENNLESILAVRKYLRKVKMNSEVGK